MASAPGTTGRASLTPSAGRSGRGSGAGLPESLPFVSPALPAQAHSSRPLRLVAPAHGLDLGGSPARAHTNSASPRPSPAAPFFMLWRGAVCWDVGFSAVCDNSSGKARCPRHLSLGLCHSGPCVHRGACSAGEAARAQSCVPRRAPRGLCRCVFRELRGRPSFPLQS